MATTEFPSTKPKEAVMNGTRIWTSTLLLLASALPAYAVDTTKTYQSGILVVAFLGICALIVVAQLIPSLVMLFSWLKGLSRRAAETQDKKEQQAN
jgi:hypothetical protein